MGEFGELTNLSESEHDEEGENQPPVKKQEKVKRKQYNYWGKQDWY